MRRRCLERNTHAKDQEWAATIVMRVCRNPATYMLGGTFHCCVAFVAGYDAAWGGGLLTGFREWLILSMKSGRNLTWDGLVLRSVLPGKRPWEELSAEEDANARKGFAELLEAFFAARQSADGAGDILYRYGVWLRNEEEREEREASGPVEDRED